MNVIEMEDGREIIDYFTEHKDDHSIDVVLTDEEMPEVNGSEALQFLRESDIDVPVVMVTGNALQHQQEEFYRLKADGFLAKPCGLDDLKKELGRYLEMEVEIAR